ncbi:hypothetical protein JQM64_12395 [Fournierella massiliensis]|nr:hypothetical protein [Fournierella massiliensis]MCF2558307.1 hypothetical protein [Fournierella massiliensis]
MKTNFPLFSVDFLPRRAGLTAGENPAQEGLCAKILWVFFCTGDSVENPGKAKKEE